MDSKLCTARSESRLHGKGIAGINCTGSQGLGTDSTKRCTGASAQKRRKLVQQEIRQRGETRFVKAVDNGK